MLAQAISSGERMDITLQKAVELGVHARAAAVQRRSIVRLDAERAVKRVEHWRQVMVVGMRAMRAQCRSRASLHRNP